MKQDKDEVIMLINYFIEKGQGNKQANVLVDNKTEKQNDKNFWAML